MLKVKIFSIILCTFLLGIAGTTYGVAFNGAADNQRDDLGYYYVITGGKFPTGNTPNGTGASGGTFRYMHDDPTTWSYPVNVWNKDGWFPENSSLALTLKNGGSIVYDNNGLEDGTYGNFYDYSSHLPVDDWTTPGLYRGYSMSNNFDFIYSGYFKLEEATVIDQIIGYFDPNNGFDPDSSLFEYDMNIWSSFQDDPFGNPNSYMPTVASFTGDVFSSKATSGTFAWSDTGVDRIFPDWSGYDPDDIFKMTYTLDTPLTLQAGEYFFSHDAEIVPEPATVALLGIGLVGLAGGAVRRRFKKNRVGSLQ